VRPDSKTLTHDARAQLLDILSSAPAELGWSVRVIACVHPFPLRPALTAACSPQAISAGMLRRPPVNLNVQSQAATVALIRAVLAAGLALSEVYVDALGPSVPYQAYLSKLFPGIAFTVRPVHEDRGERLMKEVGDA
jgi:ribonuclease H2 subunit A